MKLTQEEAEFLSAWAREEWEPACYQLPAHRLQLAHGVSGAQPGREVKARRTKRFSIWPRIFNRPGPGPRLTPSAVALPKPVSCGQHLNQDRQLKCCKTGSLANSDRAGITDVKQTEWDDYHRQRGTRRATRLEFEPLGQGESRGTLAHIDYSHESLLLQ